MMKSFYIHFITELGFQPASVDNIHSLLNPVFSAAVEDNLIRKNPCTSAMKEIREMPSWKRKRKVKGLTSNEQHRFVDFMLSTPCFDRWVNILTVLLGTGMRISEANIKIVQYLMGHEDAKTTLDIYTDVHEEFVNKTMSRSAGQIYLG